MVVCFLRSYLWHNMTQLQSLCDNDEQWQWGSHYYSCVWRQPTWHLIYSTLTETGDITKTIQCIHHVKLHYNIRWLNFHFIFTRQLSPQKLCQPTRSTHTTFNIHHKWNLIYPASTTSYIWHIFTSLSTGPLLTPNSLVFQWPCKQPCAHYKCRQTCKPATRPTGQALWADTNWIQAGRAGYYKWASTNQQQVEGGYQNNQIPKSRSTYYLLGQIVLSTAHSRCAHLTPLHLDCYLQLIKITRCAVSQSLFICLSHIFIITGHLSFSMVRLMIGWQTFEVKCFRYYQLGRIYTGLSSGKLRSRQAKKKLMFIFEWW